MAVIQWTQAAWGNQSTARAPFPLPSVAPPLRDEATLRKPTPARTRLWDITPWMHCSIIGTCLTTAELHRLLVKLGLAAPDVSDHEAHKIGVTIAARGDVAGKLLHKALDTAHRLALAQFAKSRTEDEARTQWRAAVERGDIPGAYWAVVTHPAAGRGLLAEAFGDVHMLSHLVGAANRADVRRLRDLEAARAELELKLARQQSALRDAVVSRDAMIRDLRATLAFKIATNRPTADEAAARSLRDLVTHMEDKLNRETARREAAELRATALRADLQRERALRDAAEKDAASAGADLAIIERGLGAGAPVAALRPACPAGSTILYVGGRPHLLANLRNIATEAGAAFLQHDGGLEDNDAMLSSLIARADVVMFPVDCVSHRAVGVIKRGCEKSGHPFLPLRTASTTAFLAGIARWLEWAEALA